jgi:2-oxoglutarate dehydrogenase E2 component (dihydrolipoamide succinyltransferase)
MPQLGESVTEGTVTRWLKKEGERVEADEPLLEVSTDKVDTEIPSPAAGILRGIIVAEDETVEVGAELAVIDEDGAAPSQAAAPEAEPAPQAAATEAPAPAAEPAAPGARAGTAGHGPAGSAGARPAAPDQYATQQYQQQPGYQPQYQPGYPSAADLPAAGLHLAGDLPAADRPGADAAGLRGRVSAARLRAAVLPAARPRRPAGSVGRAGPSRLSRPRPRRLPPRPAPPAPAQEAPAAPAARRRHPRQRLRPPAPAAEDAGQVLQPTAEGPYVTPLVRKLASEHGIDLATVTGTGVGGRIRKQDVLDAARSGRGTAPGRCGPAARCRPPAAAAAPSPAARADAPSPVAAPSARSRLLRPRPRLRLPTAGPRSCRPGCAGPPSRCPGPGRSSPSGWSSRCTSRRSSPPWSRRTSPRSPACGPGQAAFEAREGVKLSFLPFFALATVEALKEHPKLNAVIDTDSNQVTYHDAEHLGIAVDTERGLMVPVIRKAGDLNIAGLARKIADLADRTRAGRVSPDDLSGGTFTLTNTGSRGALFDTDRSSTSRRSASWAPEPWSSAPWWSRTRRWARSLRCGPWSTWR